MKHTVRHHKLAYLATASLIAMSLPRLAAAQTPAPGAAPAGGAVEQNAPADTGIAEIVVTAQRRETTLQRTPVAVSALDATALKDNRVADVRDLSKFVPNVAISANTGLEFPIAIRGISSSIGGIGADSPTAVNLDGVYIARPLATVFDFSDTERVEVLRGPQGTLYGRNSTAGAINIISRAPTPEPTGEAAVEVGSYNLVRAKAAVRGPVLGDTVLASLSGSYRHRDGFYTNVTTGERHVNPDDAWQVASTIAIRPQGRLRADLRADYASVEINAVSKELSGVFGAPLFTHDTADILTANNPGKSHARSGGVSATVNYDLGDLMLLKSITAIRFEKVDTTNDIDGSAIAFQRMQLGPEREKQFSQELQLTSVGWNRGSYVLGLYAFGENSRTQAIFEQYNAVPVGPGAYLDYYQNNASKIRDRNVAAFGQLDYKLTEALTLTVGARYTWERKDFRFGDAFVVAPASNPEPAQIPIIPDAVPDEIHNRGTYKAFTPKFGLSWQTTDDVLLYVSAQRGFKSGGFSFASGSAPGFGPEKIWAYEAGAKTTLLDNHLRINLTGFSYKYSDLQVSLAGGPGERFTANAADSTIRGLELEVTAQPVRGLRLSGFGSLLDATYKEYRQDLAQQTAGGVPLSASCPGGRLEQGNRFCDLSGNDLPRAPKWSYTLAASYEFQGPGYTVTPQVTWHQEANSFFSEQNIYPLETGGVESLSARVTLALGSKLKFAVYGDNLTDYRYIAGALPVPPAIAGFSNWPRTFGAELSVSF